MDNRLIELSKPTACRNKHTGRTFNATENTEPQIYESLYSQEYVSALLAELEAKDKRIVALERINKAQEDHINQQQDRIESLEKKNGDLGHGLQAAEKRIAGLVARLATPVRLPRRAPENFASVLDGYEKWLIATTFRDTWNACLDEVSRVSSGFTVEGG